jgi:SAM-dependent methyltransferase
VGPIGTSGVAEDAATIAYFDEHVPEYEHERLEFAGRFIRYHTQPGASLIDLGCGVGNVLDFLKRTAGIAEVVGVDVSENCLARTRERVVCETFRGSIFDPVFVATIERRFDFAVLAAVLHHLIGRSRKHSRRYAELALQNAASLVKPGGYVIVHEPIFYPPSAMTGMFYLKKAVSQLSTRRVGIGGYWNNIGAPVVSYYTNEQLEEMVSCTPSLAVTERNVEPESLGPLLDRMLRKTNTTLVARRDAEV